MELKGDVQAKHGKITIIFFPPFAMPPSCMLNGGKVVEETAEWIKLEDVKVKKLHYECHGVKRNEQ